MVNLLGVGTEGRGADPQIPIEMRGHGRGGRQRGPDAGDAVAGREHPDMLNRTDHPLTEVFHTEAVAETGGILDAQLRDDPGLLRRLPDQAAFVHLMAERLLAVDVLALPHRRDRRDRVVVVRNRDVDGVDPVALLFQHGPPVGVEPGGGDQLVRPLQKGGVHIAQRDDLRSRVGVETVEIAPRHVARPDTGVAQLAVRVARPDNRGETRRKDGARRPFQKTASFHACSLLSVIGERSHSPYLLTHPP